MKTSTDDEDYLHRLSAKIRREWPPLLNVRATHANSPQHPGS